MHPVPGVGNEKLKQIVGGMTDMSIGYYVCWPFAWLVRLFYNITGGSYGMAIILFTLVIKLIMLPFQMKSKRSMMRMSAVSGRIKEIQTRYQNNQAKMNEEMQKLYAEEGVNPMSGCLWSFIPLPILIMLYSIIRQPITHFMMLSKDALESVISLATSSGIDMSSIIRMKDGAAVIKNGFTELSTYGQIQLVKAVTDNHLSTGLDQWIDVNYNFLGLDLAATLSEAITNFAFTWAVIGLILIPVLSAVSQFILMRLTSKGQDAAANPTSKAMMWTMPIMSIYIAFIMPAALGLYWIAQSVFSLIQELVMNKLLGKKMEAEMKELAAAREADRQRRMEEARVQQEERKQQAVQKQTLKEKQRLAQEAKAEKARKAASSTTEAGRIGDRPYARGRAYDPERYSD